MATERWQDLRFEPKREREVVFREKSLHHQLFERLRITKLTDIDTAVTLPGIGGFTYQDAGRDLAEINSISIGEFSGPSKHRKQGYGSFLLRIAKSLAKRQGKKQIFLYCHEKVVQFYQKNGFVVEDRLYGFVKMVYNL